MTRWMNPMTIFFNQYHSISQNYNFRFCTKNAFQTSILTSKKDAKQRVLICDEHDQTFNWQWQCDNKLECHRMATWNWALQSRDCENIEVRSGGCDNFIFQFTLNHVTSHMGNQYIELAPQTAAVLSSPARTLLTYYCLHDIEHVNRKTCFARHVSSNQFLSPECTYFMGVRLLHSFQFSAVHLR